MDIWFLPFEISACFTSFNKAAQRNQSLGDKRLETICMTANQTGLNLADPRTTIEGLPASGNLYIEGHGQPGSDMAFEKIGDWCPTAITGPKNEFMDAYRLARTLKRFGFKGAHIFLHICYSAEANSFGHHFVDAMKAYGVPFKSMEGRHGEAQESDGIAGNFYKCA